MLSAGITPIVPEYGSLGCSGDLAPLATVALALIGEGEVIDAAGASTPGRRCARRCRPDPGGAGREGGPRADQRHRRHARHAGAGPRRSANAAGRRRSRRRDVGGGADGHRPGVRRRPAGAASAGRAGGQRGPDPGRARRFGDRRVARRRQGHQGAGRLLAALLAGGARHGQGHRRRTPPSSPTGNWPAPSTTRWCCPTGGWNRTATSTARRSPLCWTSWPSRSPMSPASAERRTDRMLDASRSQGLPPFLAHEVGVDSGHMIAQYTQAGIVSELKRLAVPASVDSIPSSAMQEDHVSMGWHAGRKLRRAVDGLRRVIAIEILTAARALDFRAPLTPGPVTAAVRDVVRTRVAGPGPGPPPRPRDRRRRRPARRRIDHGCSATTSSTDQQDADRLLDREN